MKWLGPYQVVEVESDHVYIIADIVTNTKLPPVHSAFLRIYEEKHFEVTEEIKEQYLHDSTQYIVAKFRDIRFNQELELLTAWKGFPEHFDTWEPFTTMLEDVPDLVKEFKRKNQEKVRKYL